MTCREKLKLDYPDWSLSELTEAYSHNCPSGYGYSTVTPLSCDRRCLACWDSELSGTETTKEDFTIIDIPADGSHVEILGHRITGDFKTFEGFLEYLRDLETTKREYEKLMATSTNIEISMIKDSGDRTEFATGAVRDMREGKGRCDLMPLEVIGEWLNDDILDCIAEFKIHGTTTFLYGALNYFSDKTFGAAYGNSKATTLLEVAKHFEEGAKKYGENNWQKGIPVKCYIDSAVRHYLKWLRGDKDEPHDLAFVWNLMCCIWEVDYREKGEKDEAV